MTPAQCLLTLLGIIVLQSTGKADFLEAIDEQTCMNLCNKCEGTATFLYNTCQCYVADDNQRGAECVGRIKRQAGELGLDIVSCDLADPDADRAARCIVSPFRHLRSRSDADLIAKYFMGNGLRGFGSLLGSAKSQTEEASSATADHHSASVAENVGDKTTSSGTSSDSDPDLVGAPNPLSAANPISGQLMDFGPLLGAAATWLHPNTLLAIGNGLQGVGTQGIVGQPNPNLMSTLINHQSEKDPTDRNLVGSLHQDTDLYSTYPAGTMGMPPYSYFGGAPNPVQLQDGSQVSPMQSYLHTYNSMVAAQNPQLPGVNNIGPSSFWNNPTSPVGAGSPQLPDPVAVPESTLDESTKADKDLLREPKPDPNLEAKKDTDSQDKPKELEANNNKVEESVVSTKRRQNRFRSKQSDAKSGTTNESESS